MKPISAADKLIARKENGIGWIIFNNPAKRNALSREMHQAMAEALEDYVRDPSVRVIILKGEGGKSFVSGGDISQFSTKRSTPEQMREGDAVSERSHDALREGGKPSIAMIQGYCMGGGLNVAVSCDLRIVSEDSKFGIPAAKIGVGYRYSNLKRLTDLIGPSSASEIFFTGRQFTAAEALAMGLVTRVLAVSELEPYVLNYAKMIIENAPLTLSAVKQCITQIRKDPADRDLELCDRVVAACFASRDYVEGRTAFVEKRKPVFEGR